MCEKTKFFFPALVKNTSKSVSKQRGLTPSEHRSQCHSIKLLRKNVTAGKETEGTVHICVPDLEFGKRL